LCYIDARDLQDRYDETVGLENWMVEFTETPGGRIICRTGLRSPERNEWIWKADGAGDTDVEGAKGAISDAFKRAGVHFGVGRYLYRAGETWAVVGSMETGETPYRAKADGKVFWWGVPAKAWTALGYDAPAAATKADPDPPAAATAKASDNTTPTAMADLLQPLVGVADVSALDVALEDASGRNANTKWKDAAIQWIKRIREMTEETDIEKRRAMYGGLKGAMGAEMASGAINQTTHDLLLQMAADHGKILRDRQELDAGYKSKV
jgi:hypothetical protein